MNIIPITKKNVIKDGEQVEVYIIPAMCFTQPDGKVKKVPHPDGTGTLTFQTLTKAVDAITLAGFNYSLQNMEIQTAKPQNYSYSEQLNVVESLINLLRDKNHGVIESAIYALGEINSEEAIKPLLQFFGKDDNGLRKQAIDALAKIGLSAIPHLIDALKDQNWMTRNSAAICLGEMSNHHNNLVITISPLIGALNDSQSTVRGSAAISLGKIYKKIKIVENKV